MGTFSKVKNTRRTQSRKKKCNSVSMKSKSRTMGGARKRCRVGTRRNKKGKCVAYVKKPKKEKEKVTKYNRTKHLTDEDFNSNKYGSSRDDWSYNRHPSPGGTDEINSSDHDRFQ
jgi:hypothetical protein